MNNFSKKTFIWINVIFRKILLQNDEQFSVKNFFLRLHKVLEESSRKCLMRSGKHTKKYFVLNIKGDEANY